MDYASIVSSGIHILGYVTVLGGFLAGSALLGFWIIILTETPKRSHLAPLVRVTAPITMPEKTPPALYDWDQEDIVN